MPNDENTESLRAAERRLQAAQLASDVDALTELIHEAALYTGPDGTVFSRQDDLDAHASGQQVLHRLDEEDLRVLAVGDTGVSWLLCTVAATVGGQSAQARMRYTRAWTRDDRTGWRVVTAHVTALADPQA